jgi:Invasion associated locus B (IalB) protein
MPSLGNQRRTNHLDDPRCRRFGSRPPILLHHRDSDDTLQCSVRLYKAILMNNRIGLIWSDHPSGDFIMMCDEPNSHRISGPLRIGLAVTLAVAPLAAAVCCVGQALAQDQAAPATKPAAQKPAAKPAAAKPSAAAAPAIGGVQPALLGQYGDWGAYTATPDGKKVCFALAKPTKSNTEPPNRPRDPAFLFVSSRPSEKVKDEISVIFGYQGKQNADATVQVAGASYAMYTQGDGAWVKNAAEESKLVDSMRKGSDLTVKGTSARGTSSTDTYSLKGLAQALDRVGQECR